jgi:hypothetical protein
MRKDKIVVLLLFVFILLAGCGRFADVRDEVVENPVYAEVEVEEPEKVDEPIKVEEPVEIVKTEGELMTEKLLSKRPVAVMFDNHSGARPQAGLSEASIVYEILAEGSITRYMGVFFGGGPELIGPVRSARPYFVDRALEYKALYVHVGGSEAALADIRKFAMGDIDAMKSASRIFWRVKHKSIPHNMYTSEEAILREAARRKHYVDVDFDYVKYNDEDVSLNGQECQGAKFTYATGKYGYTSEFKYNEDTKLFDRYVNGARHKDETNGVGLSAKNIIIQIAGKKVLDSEGRLEVYTTGKGVGYFITNGEEKSITWKKESRKALTKYYDQLGNELNYNPGTTWIQVVPKESYIGW